MTNSVEVPCSLGDTPKLSAVQKFRALAGDIKLHHSVFALPWALLATVLAGHRTGGLKAGQMLLILICMVCGRTVAMVANRLLDAEFDAANPRTARRAVPSGRLSGRYMAITLVINAAVFIAGAAGFDIFYHNRWPVLLAVPVLLFLVGYSLMKRYTRLCHYYLGAALALAPVCAWLAITGTINRPPLLMAGAVLLWTAGFDILYACQDYGFDVSHRLFSVPAKIGIGPALWVARGTHACCAGMLILLAYITPEFGVCFGSGVALAIMLLIVEHVLVRPTDLSKLGVAFFTVNGVISLLLGGLGIVDVLLH
jgi:4-hydroxybenzoate polyprenyltransferase